MIIAKAFCQKVYPPYEKKYFLRDEIDEIIFFNTYKKIVSKKERNFQINLDESLWLYCGYLINEIRSGISLDIIRKEISKVLSVNQTMIGVDEFLKNVRFEIYINSQKYTIILET